MLKPATWPAACLLALGACTLTLPDADQLTGDPCGADLIAHWAFEDPPGIAALDSSPNRFDGRISGATSTEGKLSRALQFDGQDDHVVLANPVSTSVGMTFSAWIKLRTVPPPDGAGKEYRFVIFSLGLDRTEGHHFASISNRGWAWGYGNGVSTNGPERSTPEAWSTDLWFHLAATHDYATKKVTFYRDGKLRAESTHTDAAVPLSQRTGYLGSYAGAGHLLDGALDEVWMCGRALSAVEVRRLYELALR